MKIKMSIIIGVLAILCIALATQNYSLRLQIQPPAADNELPSQQEIQERLAQLGYMDFNDIDGVVGTRTRQAWDAAVCDQYCRKLNSKK